MQRLVAVILAIGVLALCGTAAASPVFVLRGHGWGHGVGMAQWGAYGFAKHGKTYEEILAYYYPGTILERTGVAKIRVLLASSRDSVTVSSEAPFRVVDAAGAVVEVPAGSATVDAGLTLTAGGKTRSLAGPLRFSPGRAPLVFGKPYRGQLIVRVENGGLSVVNRLGLERYLSGVLPGEMSPGWPAEALRTQAVAARSYALASRKRAGSFDVYADTRSQVYGGLAVEDPRATAAITDTRREILTWQGKVAWTYFSASSGGRTAAIEDVWDSGPVPYLVSVDDPYDALSPHHDWGPITFTVEQFEQKLGARLPAGLTGLEVELNGSNRVSTVTATGTGGTTEISGATMRSLLGLKSTWFTIDTLALDPSATRIVYGQKVVLEGSLGGVEKVVVERRAGDSGWARLAALDTARSGRFRTTDTPKVTSYYRLRALELSGPAVRVAVAPRVVLRSDPAGGGVVGDVAPHVGGMTVTIQRKSGPRWEAVAKPELAAGGAFRARLDLTAGTYRAITSAAGGLVRGASKPLRVT